MLVPALFCTLALLAGGAEVAAGQSWSLPINRSPRLALSSSDPCGGKQTTCADSSTIQVCVDVGSGLMPVRKVLCADPTPLCYDGRCVEALPTTTPSPTTTWSPATASPPAPPVPEGDCQGRLAVCADCYTATLCARMGNNVVPVMNRTCGQDAPYCVEGGCVADLPANSTCPALPAPESSFKCYGTGYFPDPADCSRYHFCVGGKAYDYQCDAGLVYDQARALCLATKSCFTFDCRGRSGRYQLYGPDQTLYALCVTDDTRDALLARCPPGHRLQADADPLSVSCVPFCAAVGRSADPEDATGAGYYECLASAAGDLVGPLRGSCPPGAVFDAASQRCQPVPEGGCPTRPSTAPIRAVTTTPSTSITTDEVTAAP